MKAGGGQAARIITACVQAPRLNSFPKAMPGSAKAELVSISQQLHIKAYLLKLDALLHRDRRVNGSLVGPMTPLIITPADLPACGPT